MFCDGLKYTLKRRVKFPCRCLKTLFSSFYFKIYALIYLNMDVLDVFLSILKINMTE